MDFIDCGGLSGTYHGQRYRPLQVKPLALDGPYEIVGPAAMGKMPQPAGPWQQKKQLKSPQVQSAAFAPDLTKNTPSPA